MFEPLFSLSISGGHFQVFYPAVRAGADNDLIDIDVPKFRRHLLHSKEATDRQP